jgi:hypothetical protein
MPQSLLTPAALVGAAALPRGATVDLWARRVMPHAYVWEEVSTPTGSSTSAKFRTRNSRQLPIDVAAWQSRLAFAMPHFLQMDVSVRCGLPSPPSPSFPTSAVIDFIRTANKILLPITSGVDGHRVSVYDRSDCSAVYSRVNGSAYDQLDPHAAVLLQALAVWFEHCSNIVLMFNLPPLSGHQRLSLAQQVS